MAHPEASRRRRLLKVGEPVALGVLAHGIVNELKRTHSFEGTIDKKTRRFFVQLIKQFENAVINSHCQMRIFFIGAAKVPSRVPASRLRPIPEVISEDIKNGVQVNKSN